MSSEPFGPQRENAELMRSSTTAWPGQYTGTIRSRGNDSIEIVFVAGSARTSISVSERESFGPQPPTPARAS